jgi:hypothetical protein
VAMRGFEVSIAPARCGSFRHCSDSSGSANRLPTHRKANPRFVRAVILEPSGTTAGREKKNQPTRHTRKTLPDPMQELEPRLLRPPWIRAGASVSIGDRDRRPHRARSDA